MHIPPPILDRRFFLAALCCAWGWLTLPAGAAPMREAVDYGRDVLPILSDNCYHCHGPDEKARKAKLRLDTKEGVFRVKDDVTVVSPRQARRQRAGRGASRPPTPTR